MNNNIIIVESPAKARTISRFLGKDFIVKASNGHIRDLPDRDLGVDVDNGYKPRYVIPPDKRKVVADLKKSIGKSDIVWLASDEDREGEAIAWHLVKTLDLEENQVKRIVFHEITKSAIVNAISNPRGIKQNVVDAQQARRVLDRLVGFELSPLLWRKIKPALSAGRVQSVAVRLIVEKEKDIKNFKSVQSYRVVAEFVIDDQDKTVFKAELTGYLKNETKAIDFLQKCSGAKFKVGKIETKPVKKSPAPPFTTSTLQQEANRKLGFSVSKTMMVAQKLYESGLITYMRTDSLNLSTLAIGSAKKAIIKQFGEEYSHSRNFKTKSKNAQEAHEAIRPTYFDRVSIDGTKDQIRLYQLIWKRTIASQMSAALLERTTADILISTTSEKLVARGEVIRFDGFLKVYKESGDEDKKGNNGNILPSLTEGQELQLLQMIATERFSRPPLRYSEASLVKKLEELGIGRPSTYAPVITTIQKRNYVIKNNLTGEDRALNQFILEDGKINETKIKEKYGVVRGKFFPTDIGTVVNSFLEKYFDNIVDYNFTAYIEKEFDEIASGNRKWNEVIGEFYKPFIEKVQDTMQNTGKFSGEKLLGKDKKTGENIYVKIGRYGLIAQLGEAKDGEKPQFASLQKDQTLENITLEEAVELFKYPRILGKFENSEISAAIGKYGPYVKHKNKFYSLIDDEPDQVSLDRAIEIISTKRIEDLKKVIKDFPDKGIQILDGRWGPYLKFKAKNYKIPKKIDPKDLTVEDCLDIIKNSPARKSRKRK